MTSAPKSAMMVVDTGPAMKFGRVDHADAVEKTRHARAPSVGRPHSAEGRGCARGKDTRLATRWAAGMSPRRGDVAWPPTPGFAQSPFVTCWRAGDRQCGGENEPRSIARAGPRSASHLPGHGGHPANSDVPYSMARLDLRAKPMLTWFRQWRRRATTRCRESTAIPATMATSASHEVPEQQAVP